MRLSYTQWNRVCSIKYGSECETENICGWKRRDLHLPLSYQIVERCLMRSNQYIVAESYVIAKLRSVLWCAHKIYIEPETVIHIQCCCQTTYHSCFSVFPVFICICFQYYLPLNYNSVSWLPLNWHMMWLNLAAFQLVLSLCQFYRRMCNHQSNAADYYSTA